MRRGPWPCSASETATPRHRRSRSGPARQQGTRRRFFARPAKDVRLRHRHRHSLGIEATARPGPEVTAMASPSRHPDSEPDPRPTPTARPSRSGSLPDTAAAVSPRLGPASGPHVPAAGPRRAQVRQAIPRHRHGPEVRPGHPRGGHLLGLGQDADWIRTSRPARRSRSRSGASRSHPSSASSPRTRAWPWQPGSRATTVAGAPRHPDHGLGGPPLRYRRKELRQHPAIHSIPAGGTLPALRSQPRGGSPLLGPSTDPPDMRIQAPPQPVQ